MVVTVEPGCYFIPSVSVLSLIYICNCRYT
jgi:hypothetical protein